MQAAAAAFADSPSAADGDGTAQGPSLADASAMASGLVVSQRSSVARTRVSIAGPHLQVSPSCALLLPVWLLLIRLRAFVVFNSTRVGTL